MSDYVAAGGQTWIPPEKNNNVKFVDFEECIRPNLPMINVRPELKDKWVITCESQHFVPEVNAEMIDWFWANIEKCYYLWAPGAHKEIRWINPPWSTGLVGSSNIFVEQEEGGPFKIIPDFDPCVNLGMDQYVFDDCMEHVLIQGTPGVFVNVHMWEDVPGGINHRMCAAANIEESDKFPIPLDLNHKIVLNELKHPEYEAAMWPKFLPQMYNLWKDHPDPTQNIHWNLAVKKTSEYRWEYIHENKPVVIL